MRHCHFSILFNELPYLKQKLPFLYQFFDQIIFYDLNIVTKKFSDDGSHEFIKNYPDPENKITLIEDITITPQIINGSAPAQAKNRKCSASAPPMSKIISTYSGASIWTSSLTLP